jgi:hypothetical protein
MTKKQSNLFPLSAICLLALSLCACSNAKETLGLTRQSPDEFAVVKSAPLEIPPNFNLVPPNPGSPRPQEQSTAATAQQAVFGTETQMQTASSNGEEILLQRAGATQVDPNIRRTIDLESQEEGSSKKPVVDRLLGWGSDEKAATIVNAPEEASRLQNNAKAGKPVTDGETPTIED